MIAHGDFVGVSSSSSCHSMTYSTRENNDTQDSEKVEAAGSSSEDINSAHSGGNKNVSDFSIGTILKMETAINGTTMSYPFLHLKPPSHPIDLISLPGGGGGSFLPRTFSFSRPSMPTLAYNISRGNALPYPSPPPDSTPPPPLPGVPPGYINGITTTTTTERTLFAMPTTTLQVPVPIPINVPTPSSIDHHPLSMPFSLVHPMDSRRITPPEPTRRSRPTFDTRQVEALEHAFQTSKYLYGPDRSTLAQKLQMSEKQIKIWFQNRRSKQRKATSEEKA